MYFVFLPFQRHPTDKAYFIAKEILMTERTYKKDLEVINLVRLSLLAEKKRLSLLTFSEFVTFDFISGGRGAGGGFD